MKTALFCALFLTAGTAMAQDSGPSVYAFGGACSSQGAWTASALQSTQNLRKITLSLRDDPNCQALGTNLQTSLAGLEAAAKNADRGSDPEKTRRLSQLPNEIAALRSYYTTTSPETRSQVMGLLMDRAVEGAAVSAKVGGATPNQMAADLMRDFGQRTNESAKVGLKLFNQVVDTLPQMEQCLTADGTQVIGNLLSGIVQVATSFASSGSDTTGGQMAQTISKLTTYMRNSKFSSVLRTLNQQEFQASMACLIELTSESYCNARDSMGLFQKGMADLSWKEQLNGKITSQNPFVGYYVLNTHVPNITKWMQKIQIGVDPMLPTDAVFQNRIQQEVTDFYMGLKTLLGDYNSTLLTIRSLPNLEAKQNQVLKLIQNITESMLRGGSTSAYSNGEKTNFFTMAKTPIKIPFFLIGMDQVPEQVLGREKGLVKISYDEWLQANMSTMKEFQDPEALAETIGANMRQLAATANVSVIEYFSKWYIVDKVALVNESMVDVNYTVKDSLEVTAKYLEIAKQRIIDLNGDYSNIAMIMETEKKIETILEKYKSVAETGKLFASKMTANKLTDEDVQRASNDAAELVKTVYEQFYVMQARSGFLANRLVQIVQNDYTLLIKNKVDFSQYQKEIFIATGMAGLDRMLQMFNGNPANIKADLNMALSINKGNLDALEGLIKDNMVSLIARQKMVAEDRNGYGGTARDSVRRLIVDAFKDKYSPVTHSKEEKGSWWNPWNLAPDFVGPGAYITTVGYWWAHSDRYPLGGDTSRTPESEFEESASLRSQLCLQALAFYDQSAIFSLCQTAVLASPFKGQKSLDTSYQERFNSYMSDKSLTEQKKKSWNHSERICAFRDYNRKNLVRFMSLNKKEQQTFIGDQADQQSR
jgi:hypothetical protein